VHDAVFRDRLETAGIDNQKRTFAYAAFAVMPGRSATSASRERVSRLNSVDLPTFGRPTKAITGFIND